MRRFSVCMNKFTAFMEVLFQYLCDSDYLLIFLIYLNICIFSFYFKCKVVFIFLSPIFFIFLY